MASNLATTDSRTAMMYTGEVPWHRLGTRLDEPATAHEAIEAAGLGYEVELTRLVTVNDIPVPDKLAVVREDSHAILGVVGNTYRPVQNRECFGFLDAVVADESLRYHTAGALGKGERVWMLAKLPDDIRVKNSDDITEKYLLLSNTAIYQTLRESVRRDLAPSQSIPPIHLHRHLRTVGRGLLSASPIVHGAECYRPSES